MNVIAPGITHDQYDASKRLDVFEGRTKEWILAIARRLSEQPDSGIAVLILTSAVLEPIGGVLPWTRGAKNSEGRFCNGFVHAFPNVPGATDTWEVGREVCHLLRDGLFHEAFIKPGLFIRAQDSPLQVDSGAIYVDPKLFIQAVESAFSDLCGRIRSADTGSELRLAFDSYWVGKKSEHNSALVAKIERGEVDPAVFENTATTTGAFSGGVTHAPYSFRDSQMFRRASGNPKDSEVD